MKKELKDIEDGLMKYGYDVFFNDNKIIILHDGFVKTTPLDNTLSLLYDKLMPMNIKDVVNLLISQHKMSKDIKEGKYDNIEPMTDDELHDNLSKLINNHFQYKIYDNDIIDWYSTNLLDDVKEERKELLIRWFNLTHKEIKIVSSENVRFKALIFPILAVIYNAIHIDWHRDIKNIIYEVKNECVGILDDVDSEMKFVREYSKNKIKEIKTKQTNKL